MDFILRGDLEGLERLIDNGLDVNKIEGHFEGETLIYAAIYEADAKAAKLLLERGANPNVVDSSSSSPLHTAVSEAIVNYFHFEMDYIPVIEVLLDYGADPDIKNRFGESARQMAVVNQLSNIIELFDRSCGTTTKPALRK